MSGTLPKTDQCGPIAQQFCALNSRFPIIATCHHRRKQEWQWQGSIFLSNGQGLSTKEFGHISDSIIAPKELGTSWNYLVSTYKCIQSFQEFTLTSI